MVAVILAGGLGTRLRPVLAEIPKVLAPLGGRPFLAYLLDQMLDAGVRRAVLCTGHLGGLVEETFGSRYRGLDLLYSREDRPLGTGGALRRAAPLIESETAWVLNGDSLCRPDYGQMRRRVGEQGTGAVIALAQVADTGRYGRVSLASDGRILAFDEKSEIGTPGLINAGIYLIRRDWIAGMPNEIPLSLERDVLPEWVARGVRGVPCSGPFIDIGLPESYARARSGFARESGRDSSPEAGAVILDRDGTIIVERNYLATPDGVELLPNAARGLRRLAARGFRLVVVSNQSGVARGYFDEARLAEINARMEKLLLRQGVELAGIWCCPHHPDDGCACRKPNPGLVEDAASALGFDPRRSVVIGDRASDIELGKRIGAMTMLARTGYGAEEAAKGTDAADHVVDDLWEAARILASFPARNNPPTAGPEN